MRKINLKAERDFENAKARGDYSRDAQGKFYWATKLSRHDHNKSILKKISGKKILEIGCAAGEDAAKYVAYSENYIGLDISDESIRNATALNLKDAEFICVDGHSIPIADEEFDCVIVKSVLHHLDLEVTFKEVHRLLKADGELIFREPLGINPLFSLYRKLTPTSRTVDERPFNFSDLRLMKEYFILKDVQWYGGLCIISAFFQFEALRTFLTKIDKFVSNTPAKYFFWTFSGFATKKSK